MSVRDPIGISSRAFVGYPVQADLYLICYYCILLYVGSLSNKNQSINQSEYELIEFFMSKTGSGLKIAVQGFGIYVQILPV